MKSDPLIISLALVLMSAPAAMAFPPAPHHEIYGSVRDARGNPLTEATVSLLGSSGPILKGSIDQTIAPGVNYSLKVPMDAGTLNQLYQATALRPAMPFTVKVSVGGTDYVPIQVKGGPILIGEPGGRTRLDLTLGVDSDGDGLPDAWEQDLIDKLDGIDSLADVKPDGDADGDGASNYLEYLAGTYAFDSRATFSLEILEVRNGFARARFLAVKGRSYSVTFSSELKKFSSAKFSLVADGSDQTPLHLARQTGFQDIYIPVPASNSMYFRLQVF